MEDEQKAELTSAATEAAPVQEPPKEPVEKQSEPAPLDPRVEELIRQSEARISGRLGQTLDRVSRQNKDEARAKFDEISARLDELKVERLRGIEAAVGAGLDPVAAAAQQRALEIEFHQRKAVELEKLVNKPIPQPAPQDDGVWEARKREVLRTLDLTGLEPEFAAEFQKWNPVYDAESAAEQFRTLAKKVRKAVDARVQGKREEEPAPKKPVIIEPGGGSPPSGMNPEEELQLLLQKGAPDDPKQAKQYWKRIEELGG